MKIGDIIQVRFLDHVQFSGTGAQPIEIEAIGRILSITKSAIELGAWITTDPAYASNNEGFIILRKTLVGKVKLLR